MRSVRRAGILAGALAVGLAVTTAAPASAAAVTPVAGGFVGPLGLAVGSDGTLYVADAFLGSLTALDKQGRRTTLAEGAIGGGVAALGKGQVVFTDSVPPESGGAGDTRLMRVTASAKPRPVTSMFDFENANNPDAGNTYGFVDLTPACAAQVDEAFGGELPSGPYTGIIESNPYAVAIDGGSYLVADAAGNSIVRVGANGRASTVAVLPPVPTVITAEAAAEFGAPPCVVGARYLSEPVPTDVEIGPGGYLYVSSLPGFPEAPGTGSVFRISPSGQVQRLATGFSGAVDLAVTAKGTVYVAELFGGRISKVSGGQVSTLVEVPSPGAVEVAPDGSLFATIGVFGDGQVVRITP